jgi:hypothetical protein
MMTTGSDPAAGLQNAPSDASPDSPPGKSRVGLALSLVVIATVLAAIFYWFKREDAPPVSDAPQTEP